MNSSTNTDQPPLPRRHTGIEFFIFIILTFMAFACLIDDVASANVMVERLSAIWPSFVAALMYITIPVLYVLNQRRNTSRIAAQN